MDEFKIVQHEVDEVEVILKPHKEMYPQNGNDRIVAGFKKRMGQDVNVTVSLSEDIPRDASGKYRYVVSKVASFK